MMNYVEDANVDFAGLMRVEETNGFVLV